MSGNHGLQLSERDDKLCMTGNLGNLFMAENGDGLCMSGSDDKLFMGESSDKLFLPKSEDTTCTTDKQDRLCMPENGDTLCHSEIDDRSSNAERVVSHLNNTESDQWKWFPEEQTHVDNDGLYSLFNQSFYHNM